MKIYLAAAVLLAACTAGEQATNLREGMSPEEVAAILGRPDGVQRAGGYIGYQYTNRLISGWSWDRADYVAVFEDSKLVQWGPGEVRQGRGPNIGTLVVLP
jgi:hypothetical protein